MADAGDGERVHDVARWRPVFVAGAFVLLAVTACTRAGTGAVSARPVVFAATPGQIAFLDTVQRRTFDWFWETTNTRNGLVPDRWPTKSFSSIAAVGFGLTAYPIGVERGWITRE